MYDVATGLVLIGIMLTIYFWKKDVGKRNLSIILTVISFVLFGVFSPNDSYDETKEKDSSLSEVVRSEEPEEKNILFYDGHPFYGGSEGEAKEYAENFDKGVVSFGQSDYSEDSIIHISRVLDDIINSLELYISRVDEDFSENEILDVVKEYLPNNEILEDYEEPEFSKYLTSTGDTNKLIQYVSKEGIKTNLGTINIIIYEEEDKAKTIQMTSQRPNSVSPRKANMIEEHEWNPDF